MRVVLFGASGMVGQGVLRECVLSPEVSAVLSIARRAGSLGAYAGVEKVRELVTEDFYDFTAIEPELAGYDACFFCLGVSSVGMKEIEYRTVTQQITMAAARSMLRANSAAESHGSNVTFLYVSGAGTDANSRTMWARVKGEVENDLLAMPFRAAYMFRPGAIVPMHGVRSKTALYQTFYSAFGPVMPLLLRAFPRYVNTTEQVGRAMLHVARDGYGKHILEPLDIAACGSASA